MSLIVYQKPVNINKLQSILDTTANRFDTKLVPETVCQMVDEMDQQIIKGLTYSKLKIEEQEKGRQIMTKELIDFKTS